MSTKFVSYGKVTDGKIIPYNNSEFVNWIKAKEGEDLEIVVRVTKNSKTFRQLRLVYRMYSLISDYTGYEVNEVHVLMKSKFLEPQIYEIGDEIITECATLADISKKELSVYINQVADWAAREFHLVVLTGEERQFLKEV